MVWIVALSLLGVVVLLVVGNTALRYLGVLAPRDSPAALAEMLAPHMHPRWPATGQPHPTALLLSGCDGPADNLDRLTTRLAEIGWGSVIVDSHGARGYTARPVWTLICAGQLFTGTERAGDLAVALDMVRAMPEVDPDRIALIGASHGGWAVLDLLSLHARGRRPPNLTRWPESLRREGLAGVVQAILYYPYCGPGARVWRHGWRSDIPVSFLLVEGDSVADDAACRRVVERARAAGRPVEIIDFAGVTHGFDQRQKAPLSPLEFDADATARALDEVAARLAPWTAPR
jgi:dienelactone hydrolase